MRVVIVSKALVVGAYQRKLEELVRRPGITLTAIVPAAWRDGHDVIRLERAHTTGYELIVAPLAFNGQFHLHFYPTLGRLLRALRPDVLHVDEEPYNLATWHALRIGTTLGAAGLFFTWQNLDRRYPWPFRYFERINYRRAAYAIAGNQTAVDVLRRKGYRGRLAVIPQFGIDPEIFSPAPSVPGPAEAAQQRAEELKIGYAGRLVPEKGVDVLLRACAMLPWSGWSLSLLGRGPERDRLAALAAELGITRKVTFLGHLPSTQTPQAYRAFDVLVVPSISRPNWIEQFGRVIIEAMACGVPVIGSDSGEIPYVIGDAGLIFPEGNPVELAQHLTSLASDPARRAYLAARGRERVLAHFTQAHVAAATAAIYQEMVERA